MSERKHTALPWHIECEPTAIWSKGGRAIANYATKACFTEDCANASLTIRAVAAYDDLVAACEACEQVIEKLLELGDSESADGVSITEVNTWIKSGAARRGAWLKPRSPRRKADDTVCDAINAIEDAMSELARAKAKLEELE